MTSNLSKAQRQRHFTNFHVIAFSRVSMFSAFIILRLHDEATCSKNIKHKWSKQEANLKHTTCTCTRILNTFASCLLH